MSCTFKNSLLLLFLSVLPPLSGCAPSPSFSVRQALPETNAIPGWKTTQEAQAYTKDTIFSYIDGQSEFYFLYGFETVALGQYQNDRGEILDAEIWQVAAPADAYGLYSTSDSGAAVSTGKANDASLEDQSRIVFWQDRFYVMVRAQVRLPNEDLLRFTEAISNALPSGGTRPALMDRLPAENRVEHSETFFHEEMAIQNDLWLGGENILNLSPQTDGALAAYAYGENHPYLMLVQYPDAASAAAAAAAAALKASLNGGLDDLAAVDVRGSLLGAVFGPASMEDAVRLLHQALDR